LGKKREFNEQKFFGSPENQKTEKQTKATLCLKHIN
jgi:hypothetical protein